MSQPDPAAVSRVRNAARDVANDLIRFERDWQRLMDAMNAVGRDERVIHSAFEEALDTEERRTAFNTIIDRLRALDRSP